MKMLKFNPLKLEEAKSLLGKAVFVDVRSPADYAAGHIPGAINFHQFFTYLSTSNYSELHRYFDKTLSSGGLNVSKQMIFYEGRLNGLFGSSCRANYLMGLMGYPNTYNLVAGYQGWLRHKLPTETQVVTSTPSNNFNSSLSFNANLWITSFKVKQLLEKNKTVFLDVRDKIEYTAGSSSPYGKDFAPRKGRLPGAKNIEWYNFMKQKEDGEVEFKSPEEIEKLMNSVGIKKDTETCLYCFKGARASNSYFALQQAGFTKVRMYFQGWNEWSRDDSLPIDSTQLKLD